MTKSISSIFIYPYWTKALGLVLITSGLGFFLYRISAYSVVDLSGLSFLVAAGLIMIFFSQEKTNDERIAYLKFKSLAFAVPLAAVITMVINYAFNYKSYSVETDNWFSISAFEYLSITLLLAIGWFNYLKVKE